MTEKHYLQAELEELLQDGPSIWEFLQAGSLDGIWYWDLENPGQEWMSPELWRLFGIDPKTRKHDPAEWQNLIFQEDLAVALENFNKHCEDPDHPYDQIVRYRHADGSTVWVRCRGIAIRNEQGKAIRMLGAHNDLTAVKQAEADLATANEELASFAYSISHDLKSPSNTMQMLIDEVIDSDEGGLSADQRHLLELCQKTVAHMRGLVDSLLSYTQMVGEEMTWDSVDLNTLVNDVIDNIKALAESAKAEFQIEELPTISGNHFQLSLLLQNLLENAIKYRRLDKPLVIGIRQIKSGRRGAVTISVSDNGIGIEKKHRDKVFDMFKRLHRQDQIQGAGLGLSFCRKIMNNHNGEITLVSNESGGTTVNLAFPEPNID